MRSIGLSVKRVSVTLRIHHSPIYTVSCKIVYWAILSYWSPLPTIHRAQKWAEPARIPPSDRRPNRLKRSAGFDASRPPRGAWQRVVKDRPTRDTRFWPLSCPRRQPWWTTNTAHIHTYHPKPLLGIPSDTTPRRASRRSQGDSRLLRTFGIARAPEVLTPTSETDPPDGQT